MHKHHQAQSQRAACEQKAVPVIRLATKEASQRSLPLKKEMPVKVEQPVEKELPARSDQPASSGQRAADLAAVKKEQPALKTKRALTKEEQSALKKERKLSVVKEESEYEGDDEDDEGTVPASYACDEAEWYAAGNAESDPYL